MQEVVGSSPISSTKPHSSVSDAVFLWYNFRWRADSGQEQKHLLSVSGCNHLWKTPGNTGQSVAPPGKTLWGKGLRVKEKGRNMLTKSDLLGESDYLPAMEGPVAAWLRDTVLSGNLSSFDDTALRYYYAIPEGAKGIVLMVHGLSEFFGKYHEMAWYFYRSGFGFFFLEQRGHGYSGGKLPDAADIVVIDDFRTYMKDLKCFYDRIVDPRSEGLPKVIFAHSMGGAVSALFLENYPGLFKGAVFSSPMFRLSTGGQGPAVVLAVKTFVKLTGRMELPGPGQHRFDRTPAFETSSALSKAR